MGYIGLLDCNNFFVSCERLFRPDILGKPVAVLSSNDGCIVARSQEVKDLGIPMGIPYFKIKDIAEKEGIVLFSSNFAFYRDISARVMETLKEVVGECEVYSIDEAFFTLSEENTNGDIEGIREIIQQRVGIPVSIGVGRSKTIAKQANQIAKRGSGVCVFSDTAWRKAAKNISCGSLWGVGRQTSTKLRSLGIESAADVTGLDRSFLKAHLGVAGERLQFELLGAQAGDRAGDDISFGKSIMSTRSFGEVVHDLKELERAVGYHVTYVAKKLRERQTITSRLVVVARASRYSDYSLRKGSIEVVLSEPTNDTEILLKEALAALRSFYNPEIPYKKAGVIVTAIAPSECATRSLFGEDKKAELSSAVDRINARFGDQTVLPAIVLGGGKWRANARLRSPEYTTKWRQLMSVKAI